MATHYFPGELIPTPLPAAGWSETWNNASVASLPPNAEYPQYGPGYDPVRPFGQINGSLTVIFHIVGEDRTVQFFGSTPAQGGVVMTLYSAGNTENGAGLPWIASTSSSSSVAESNPAFFQPTAGFSRFLVAGRDYYVEIGNAAGTAGEDITLEVTYQALEANNNLRANAYNVYVAADGATYTSKPVVNFGFTNANNGTDDPTNNTYERTAWWKYQPLSAASITASWSLVPANDQEFGMRVWKENLTGTGSMTSVGESTTNPGTVTFTSEAGATYYIEIGATGSTYYMNAIQKYNLTVTGAQSAVQDPNPDDGGGGGIGGEGGSAPGNDHRANAYTIPITSTARYKITDSIDITNATQDTGDYGDPWSLHYDQSLWWKWKSDVNGTATMVTYKDPDTADPAFNVQILDSNANDSLIRQAPIGTSVDFKIVKGHTYYFGLGISGTRIITHYEGISLSMSLKVPGLPSAKTPVAAKPGTASKPVLDLIREFQAATGYAVRIIDAHTIEVVDPDEPMPDDFTSARAESYYTSVQSDLAASNNVLRLDKGDLDVTGYGELLRNDIGIVLSGWDMPQRLPFPGADPARVSRVTMSFSRDSFTCNVDFVFDDIPIDTRRD